MRVLVPVEGSRHALEGVRVASHYAGTRIAAIYLLTVVPLIADVDLELSASDRDRLLECMKKRGDDVLSHARDPLRSCGCANVKTVLITAASVAQAIVSFAENEKMDLIVIGSKGMGATARFFLGSVASQVVRYSPCSVYVVREPDGE